MTEHLISERGQALILAAAVLDRPNGDPDDDLAVLARQLNRAQEEVDRQRELLSAYVADENRFNRGEGEAYGSISTETGMRARAAIASR